MEAREIWSWIKMQTKYPGHREKANEDILKGVSEQGKLVKMIRKRHEKTEVE